MVAQTFRDMYFVLAQNARRSFLLLGHLKEDYQTLRLCLGVWRGRKGKALRGAKYEEK
jgi:hypothetical protein